MGKYPFEAEINAAAKKYNLTPDLVAAFAFIESSFKPYATRYEAKFQRKYVDIHPNYEKLDSQTRNLLASSLGLMQVMGVVAHEHGLPYTLLKDLLKPAIGLEYGCKQLSQLVKRYVGSGALPSPMNKAPNALTDVISAYNAGTARRGDKGGYPNQGYVNKVMARYKSYMVGSADMGKVAIRSRKAQGGVKK